MPQAQNQIIRPAAPEPLLAGLLALTEARLLSLEGAYETDLPDGSRELIAGVRGAPVLRFSQAEAEIPAGGLALLSQPGSCRLTATGDCQCAILRLTGTLPEQLLSPEDACVIYPQGAAAVRETVTALAVLNREGSGIDAPTASAHAYSLLMKLLRLRDAGAPSHYSALIDAAIGIINEDFAYLEGLDDLAERLEVSKPHLIRTFTREVGVSPANISPAPASNTQSCCSVSRTCPLPLPPRQPVLQAQITSQRCSAGKPACPPPSSSSPCRRHAADLPFCAMRTAFICLDRTL